MMDDSDDDTILEESGSEYEQGQSENEQDDSDYDLEFYDSDEEETLLQYGPVSAPVSIRSSSNSKPWVH